MIIKEKLVDRHELLSGEICDLALLSPDDRAFPADLSRGRSRTGEVRR